MTFVNDLYVTSLRDAGHASRGLDFEFDAAGRVRVNLVTGKHVTAHYSGSPNYNAMNQWRTIVPEVSKKLGATSRHLYVIFAETYDRGPWRFEWPGGVALGGRAGARGGIGLFSAWVLQDMFCATDVAGQLKLLADATPIRGRKALGAPRGNSPRFEFIEDGFGAVAHELGHALTLWHDHRRDRLYIMGNGFRSLQRNYLRRFAGRPKVCFSPDNTRILAYTRFLGEALDLTDRTPPTIRLTCPDQLAAGATKIDIAADLRDDRALKASVVFCSQGDSVLWGATHSGKSASVKFTAAITAAKGPEIRIHFGSIDGGGNFARANRKIPVR